VVALWGVPLRALGAALSSMDARWLVPVAAVFLVQQLLRAIRQAVLLGPVAPDIGLRTSLAVLCISFFCINTLPARLGELVRPTLLLERAGVPLGSGFALVFLERVIDLCATLIMLSAVVWLVPTGGPGGATGPVATWLHAAQPIAAVALPLGVGSLVAVLALGGPLSRLLAARLPVDTGSDGLPIRLLRRLLGFLLHFLAGLRVLRDPRRLVAIGALTAITWSWSGFIYVALAHGYGIQDLIGWGEGIGVMCTTMLGTILPAPPGFAGTYEAFARAGLAAFGVAGEELAATAVAFALTVHWFLYSVQALTAVWFLAADGIDLSGLLRRTLTQRAPAVAPGDAR
jgi:glycosyltransferase 2 family protein